MNTEVMFSSARDDWVSKALSEANDQSTIVVMLIPARTDTLWFHNYIYQKPTAEVRFIKGRLKFGGDRKILRLFHL